MAVACSAWLAVRAYCDKQTIEKGMPPGYNLQCDDHGNYRPTWNGHPLYWTQRHGTKAQAMRRAWRQYYFIPAPEPKDTANWKLCE